MKIGDVWYRIEDCLVSTRVDEFDNPLGPPQVRVSIREFRVVSITPKGVWLDRGLMGKRFVLREARKKYACATLEMALESFKARKKKQIRIYKSRIENAELAVYRAEQDVGIKLRYITSRDLGLGED